MSLIKPKKLNKGDLIGVISPASSPDDLTRIEKGVNYLESLGYRVEVGKNVGKYNGYLAGTDDERLEDLHYMFQKKNIKAIFSVRGGYGSGRLLDKINYNLIKKNPKIFVGYSDINALQLAFYTKVGLISFIGPMVAVDFYNEVSSFTEENFWKIITSDKKIGKISNPNSEKFFTLNKGKAIGKIIGSNLTLLTSLFGTEYFPKLKDSILLLEDINEEPYRIDRMLNQLRLAGKFEKAKGIVFGFCNDCTIKTSPPTWDLQLGDVLDKYFSSLPIPSFYGLMFGHTNEQLTLPYSIEAILDADAGTLLINEAATI